MSHREQAADPGCVRCATAAAIQRKRCTAFSVHLATVFVTIYFNINSGLFINSFIIGSKIL